jgi:hypothetical protein
MDEPSKPCRLCGVVKPLSDFHAAAGCRDGRRGECIPCFKFQRLRRYAADPTRRQRDVERVRAWEKANPEKAAAKLERARESGSLARSLRKTHLKKKYGMTLEDYERMLEAQGGGCAICGRPPREDISLHVDHDHETGLIRGLLCFPCNNAIGLMKDDPERLHRAADYVATKRRLETLLDGRGLRAPRHDGPSGPDE